MFERFTDAARQVLVLAQEEARLLNHGFIGTEHLLLGLMAEGESVAAHALASFDVELPRTRQMAVETIGLSAHGHLGSPPFTPRSKKVLELSLRSALQLGHSYIGAEHILLGLINEGEGVGCQILVNLGVELPAVRQRVIDLLSEVEGDVGERLTHRPAMPPELRSQMDEPLRHSPDIVQSKIVTCSFCGSTPPASGQMISGSNAFICERCVRQWWIRLRQTRPMLLGPSPIIGGLRGVRPGPHPNDPEAARNEIETAFTGPLVTSEDGQSLPLVERGSNLGPTLAAAQARHPTMEANFTVDEVVFIDQEHAAVLFTITTHTGLTLPGHRGDAVVEGGAWKMARSTFCRLIGMAGVPCPPEDT